jgi:ketosteroid isomerase-like protein
MPGSTVPAVAAQESVAVPSMVTGYFDALNREDWALMRELWDVNAELRAVGARPRRGRDEVMSYLEPIFGPWATHLDQPTRFIVAPSTVVVEVRFTGVTHAGRELPFDAVDVFDTDDHAILRLTTWYDLAWLRKQL